MSEKKEQMNKAEPPKKGRWLIEYGPLLLFFDVNYFAPDFQEKTDCPH